MLYVNVSFVTLFSGNKKVWQAQLVERLRKFECLQCVRPSHCVCHTLIGLFSSTKRLCDQFNVFAGCKQVTQVICKLLTK